MSYINMYSTLMSVLKSSKLTKNEILKLIAVVRKGPLRYQKWHNFVNSQDTEKYDTSF